MKGKLPTHPGERDSVPDFGRHVCFPERRESVIKQNKSRVSSL